MFFTPDRDYDFEIDQNKFLKFLKGCFSTLNHVLYTKKSTSTKPHENKTSKASLTSIIKRTAPNESYVTKVKCHKCHKLGHYANKCSEGEQLDKIEKSFDNKKEKLSRVIKRISKALEHLSELEDEPERTVNDES